MVIETGANLSASQTQIMRTSTRKETLRCTFLTYLH